MPLGAHRHGAVPAPLSRTGCSRQFGRASAPMMPHCHDAGNPCQQDDGTESRNKCGHEGDVSKIGTFGLPVSVSFSNFRFRKDQVRHLVANEWTSTGRSIRAARRRARWLPRRSNLLASSPPSGLRSVSQPPHIWNRYNELQAYFLFDADRERDGFVIDDSGAKTCWRSSCDSAACITTAGSRRGKHCVARRGAHRGRAHRCGWIIG
jgi:hypothetical protein